MLIMKESDFSCVEEKNVGLPTFKLPASTKNMLRLTR